MPIHVMLDLETLDTKTSSVILSLGAVKFDPYESDSPSAPLYIRPDVDEQFREGRTASESTLDWWANQTEEARLEAFGDDGRISIRSMLNDLNRYLVGIEKIWANGVLFDIGILEDLYCQYEQPVPWQYWQIRDSRTIYDMGDDSAKTGNKDLHNALADSYHQAVAVQNIYAELNVKPK